MQEITALLAVGLAVVYLAVPGSLRSEGGRELWTHEAWYTLNRLPPVP